MKRRFPLSRESSLILLDQLVSSGSNALAVFIAAWSLSLAELNLYALFQLAVTTLIGLQRAIYIEPGLSLTSNSARLGRAVTWSACTWLPLSAVVGVTCSIALQSPLPLAVALAAVFPGVQDLLRYRLFALKKIPRVLVSDLLWLILLVAGYFALSPTTAAGVLTLWGASAGIAAIVAVGGRDSRPSLSVREVVRLGRYQVAEWGIAATTSTVPLFVVGALLPASPVGAYRLAQTLTGPLNTISSFVTVKFLVNAERLKALPRGESHSLLKRASLALIAVAVLYSIAALLAVIILGETLGSAVQQQLVFALPVTLASSVITAPAVAYIALIKARSQQRLAIRPRVVTLVVNVSSVALGLLVWSWLGFDPLVLPIIATALSVLLAWRATVRRALKE